MIAAASAGVPAVDEVFVGPEPDLGGVFVKAEGDIDRLAPAGRGLDVDLDHAGIGRHFYHVDARVERRWIALDMDLHLHLFGSCFYRGDQFEVILQLLHRRHEGAQNAVADLDRHRGADTTAAFDLLLLYVL